jgi:hypothetical protein
MAFTPKFTEKRKCVKRIVFAEDNKTPLGVSLYFKHGTQIDFSLEDVAGAPTMAAMLTLHGYKQKVGDEGADAETSEEYYERALAMHARVLDGSAFERAEGVRFESTEDLVAAIAELQKIEDLQVVRDLVKALKGPEREALRAHKEVKKIMDRNAAKKVADSKVDANALLAKLVPVKPVDEKPTEPATPAA